MALKNLEKFYESVQGKKVTPRMIMYRGELFERLPYGYSESDVVAEEEMCPQCGCAEGQLHKSGCSHEVCPICEGKLAVCSCECFIV